MLVLLLSRWTVHSHHGVVKRAIRGCARNGAFSKSGAWWQVQFARWLVSLGGPARCGERWLSVSLPKPLPLPSSQPRPPPPTTTNHPGPSTSLPVSLHRRIPFSLVATFDGPCPLVVFGALLVSSRDVPCHEQLTRRLAQSQSTPALRPTIVSNLLHGYVV